MVKLIKYGFVFIGLMLAISVKAQVYPVSGNAVLVPPFSVYLADYTSPTSDRLISNIVLNDASRPDLRVRLRIKITGQNISLETKPEYIGREIVLEGGVPLRLTGIDLAEYFNPNNLNFSGITRRTFEQTGALPQGFYQFCIEVLEYNRGVKISNTICAPGWLILNDPPIINLPRNGEKLKPLQPQNVVFQWTPRHTGSPNSAFTTEYDIKLVEIWPANRNPNDAILTSPPILEATTRSTTFIYDVSQTPLELGRNYALQVKAKSLAGVDELDLFKNNGRSEVITFTYGDPCEIPLYVTAQGVNPSRIKIQWQGQLNHTGYEIRYRTAGNPGAQWFLTNSLMNEVEISSLKANTTYEYQVSGQCGFFQSDMTMLATVSTKASPVADYSCGLPMQSITLDASSLIPSLKVGDIVQAGDFEVQLTKVSGSSGLFSGEGIASIPLLNNVKVKTEFQNITVNTDLRMVKGYMNVTGAAVDLVPDQVMAMMDELTQSLDKLDAALDKAENVLEDIDAAIGIVDKVIEEVKAYLPDPIIQQIAMARNDIAVAREAIKNASTPEEKEAANVQLKEAKNKLKAGAMAAMDHYAETIADLLKLIKEVLKQITTETKSMVAELTGKKTSADREVEGSGKVIVDSRMGVAVGDSTKGEVGNVYTLSGGTQEEELKQSEIDLLRQNPQMKAYLDKLTEWARIVSLLEANTKILQLVEKAVNDDNLIKNYAEITKKKAEAEEDTLKQAIKNKKLNTPEIRDLVIKILKDALFQDYLNATK